MFRNVGRSGQRPPLERKYGFFKCNSCQGEWQSAHVYCVKDTDRVYYKQECKNCKIACNPYRLEDVMCSNCWSPAKECRGTCTDNHDDDDDDDYYDDDEDDDDDEKSEKPHRADLCHKCRSGWKCV